MYEPGEHYIKQHSYKRQILHGLTYMWNLKMTKLTEISSRMVVLELGRDRERLIKGCKISVRQEEEVHIPIVKPGNIVNNHVFHTYNSLKLYRFF
jgi:hypothetical protein